MDNQTETKKQNGWFLLFKSVLFLLILSILIAILSFMVTPKDNTALAGMHNPSARGFYSEPENSIDIFMIGNSDAYSGFSPMELWHNKGYTSYVSGEGLQIPPGAINMLNEILTCQKPKLVILETDEIFTSGSYVDSFSKSFQTVLAGKIPLINYHNQWKVQPWDDFFAKTEYTSDCFNKGQYLSRKNKGYSGKEYMKKSKEVEKILPTIKLFVDRFVQICDENNIKLLFLQIPSETSWSYKRHNAMQAYANQKQVPFLDLDLNRAKFGFNWKTDSRDHGNHLNSAGAKKLTKYLGDYLSEHYSFKDRRNDVEFAKWNTDYKRYLNAVKKTKK